MRGKEKCRMLRDIRRRIAEQNEIALITEECEYKGECRGTCPKCESELKYLEEQLEKRRQLGKKVALAGIAASTALALGGCSVVDAVDTAVRAIQKASNPEPTIEILSGEVDDIEVMGDVPFVIPLE